MRRRKANRGRPRKVKTDNNNVQKDVSSAFTGEADENSETDSTTTTTTTTTATTPTKHFDFNEKEYDAKLNKIGPTTYRIGSTQLDMENAGDDLKPIFRDNDILFQVECGSNKAQMYLSKLCQGSKGSCIQYDGSWLTPNEFQFVSGRETAKDWKRSIRHFGRSLKLLLTKGILAVHPTACRCDSCCFLTSSDDKPSLTTKQLLKKAKAKSKSKGRPRKVKSSGENKISKCDKNVKDAKESGENCKTEPMEQDEYQDSTEDGSAEDESENENGEASESGGGTDSGGDDGEETEEENGNDRNNSGNEGKEAAESSSDGSSESESSTDSSDTEPNNDGNSKAAATDAAEQGEKDEEDDEEDEDMDTSESPADERKKAKKSVANGISVKVDNADSDVTKADDTDKVIKEIKMDVDPSSAAEDKNTSDNERVTNSDPSKTYEPFSNSEISETFESSEVCEPSAKPDSSLLKETKKSAVQTPSSLENQLCSTLMDKIAETIEQEIEKPDLDADRSTKGNSQQNSKPASPIKFDTPSPIKFKTSDKEVDEEDSDGNKDDSECPKAGDDKPDSAEKASMDFKKDCSVVKVEDNETPQTEESSIKSTVNNNNNNNNNNNVKTESVGAAETTSKAPCSPLERVAALGSTPPASPARKSIDKPNSSSQGKSRLSSIIDILRTSKERECQKPSAAPESKTQNEKIPPTREPGLPSVPPKPKEKPDPPKPKTLPAEDIATKDRPHNAFRYPASLLPFGYPSPEQLEKVSREAHDQLSKYHRQFEKNLESMIAQNMNPFIPELSIYSLPEHRAQMELHYMQTMEQLARQQYVMAENRSRQMIHENNLLIGKLHDRLSRGSALPTHAAVSQHNNVVNSKHGGEKKTTGSSSEKRSSAHHNQQHHHRDQSSHSSSHLPAKALPAHRHVPDTRQMDKHNPTRLQSPPAAHGHHSAASHSSSKVPSVSTTHPLFVPSSSAATHPRADSVPVPSSSPLAGALLPQQMWSSCFPFVVPPPSLETTRLTQFFPNLNSGVKTPKESLKHQLSSTSSALDLSTKKQKTSRNSDVHSTRVSQSEASSSKSPQLASSNCQTLRRSLQEGKTTPVSSESERKNSSSGCTCGLKHVDDIRTWSVKDVCNFIKRLDGCSVYSEIFLRFRVDGRTLPLLTTDHLTKSFGMKLGSALILTGAIARKLRDISQIVPCEYCRKKISRE